MKVAVSRGEIHGLGRSIAGSVAYNLLYYHLPSASVLSPRITGGKNTKSSPRHKLSAPRDHEQVVRQRQT